MRSTLMLALAFVLACKGDRPADAPTRTALSVQTPRGPDNLVLRIAQKGGTARVYAYPRLDTIVWSAPSAPAPARILGFDDEAGEIAYVDGRGLPARLDFRQGGATTLTKAKLTSLVSNDGSAIYAIAADGAVQRFAESGTWKWKPPLTPRALFPQPDGSLLVLAERKEGSVVWRLRPPSTDVVDSAVLPRVDRALRTQVGDRLYLGAEKELTGLRTRTMERTQSIRMDEPIELLAATPSGDRVFVVIKGDSAIHVVDRYQEKETGAIELRRHVGELRMDPLGRYLLARPEGVDSAIVIALATNHIVGAVATGWRADLPFVAPDGGIAVAQGPDVYVVDGESLRPRTRVRGGAADFWYPFRWTGFRPRAAALDQPVEFAGVPDTARVAADTAARPDSAVPPVVARDTTHRAAPGWTVSFAALLVADRARELASQIHVGDQTARVITASRDGSTIYRVVLGPYATREEAERVGRESRNSYWVYEGGP
ncbi:MAG: SPOR domain-containing protein [Gemmatimonadaceae bacterium]|nr:SPOR domain-containing protein [Gemmatimonadaceae bacterium]NUS33945.1 SPOR domain-containing protein [Gemmatimonadaceae bacterium]